MDDGVGVVIRLIVLDHILYLCIKEASNRWRRGGKEGGREEKGLYLV